MEEFTAMQPIERICDAAGRVLALVIRAEYSVERTSFFSEADYSQQVGIIKYPKDGVIKPHYHNEVLRQVVYTQEVLIIRKGSVSVDLFDASLTWVRRVELKKGDTVFLIAGGHGFTMNEDAEMLEVKQGPYSGVSNDKTQFAAEKGA
jgi:hypothetical protein